MRTLGGVILGLGLALVATGAVAEPGKLHNWGRWGAGDERGAANLLTPEALVHAAGLIQKGKTFSLAIPIDMNGPVFPGRLNPHHTMTVTGADYHSGGDGLSIGRLKFADDYIYMALQGSTQWDGLSHGWYDDELYNGVPESAIRSAPMAGGATKLGIENVKDSLVGRGVLVDVLRHKGGTLAPGVAITRADVEAALAAQGTEIRPGDIVVFRTGWVPGFYALADPVERTRYLLAPQTGLDEDLAPWIHEKKITAVAADNVGLEVFPPPEGSVGLHGALLRDQGVYIGEIWWLEELAADCAEDGRYEFFLAAQPLHIPGAVGSPLNPLAIK